MQMNKSKLETMSETSSLGSHPHRFLDREETTNTRDTESVSQISVAPWPSKAAENAPLNGSKERLGQTTVACIVINYISAGYILLPSVFAQTGLLLATFVLLIVCLQSYSTALFLLESGARAEALGKESLPPDYRIMIRKRKYEISVLTRIFLGENWARFFCFTTAFDLYCITWTFCSVFAATLSERFPIFSEEQDSYNFFVGIFLCIALPLSCVSILDQIYVQLTFLGLRMLMVALMMVTIIWATMHPSKEIFGDSPEGSSYHTNLASFGGLLTAIQTCIFATAFQFAVPSIAAISEDNSRLSITLGRCVAFVFVSNLILALFVSTYLGDETNESNNLNWLSFGRDSSGASRGTFGRIISYYVVLMAAIDGLAVYPLNTIPLGEGLMGAFLGTCHQPAWKTRLCFHLLASFPQALAAFFVRDLGRIAQFGGIFTLLSYTLCPAWLQLASQKQLQDKFDRASTEHGDYIFSSSFLARGLCALSVLVIVAVATEAITAME